MQKLHRVQHGHPVPEPLRVRRDLDRAAGVGGGHELGARVEQVARLATAELGGRLRLHEVVDAGRPAADLPLGRIDELELRDHAQEVARLKGREQRQPIALLAGSVDRLLERVPELDARALLAGPYTLILPNPERRYPWLTGERPDTIGVRLPKLPPPAAEVLDEVGAVLATSANAHGGSDPRRLEDVPEEIRRACGALVDGGELSGNLRRADIYSRVLRDLQSPGELSEIHINDLDEVSVVVSGEPIVDLGATDFNGVLPLLYGRPHPSPAILAATRSVARAFAESDGIAVNIVQRGARLLAGMAATVAHELALDGGPVYLAGGAFENVVPLEKEVRLALLGALPRAAVEPLGAEPAMGAARLAATLAWGAA